MFICSVTSASASNSFWVRGLSWENLTCFLSAYKMMNRAAVNLIAIFANVIILWLIKQ